MTFKSRSHVVETEHERKITLVLFDDKRLDWELATAFNCERLTNPLKNKKIALAYFDGKRYLIDHDNDDGITLLSFGYKDSIL